MSQLHIRKGYNDYHINRISIVFLITLSGEVYVEATTHAYNLGSKHLSALDLAYVGIDQNLNILHHKLIHPQTRIHLSVNTPTIYGREIKH